MILVLDHNLAYAHVPCPAIRAACIEGEGNLDVSIHTRRIAMSQTCIKAVMDDPAFGDFSVLRLLDRVEAGDAMMRVIHDKTAFLLQLRRFWLA